LLESLKQDDPSVRVATARALGEAQADSDEVIAALTKALADKNRDVRNAAIRALGRIGSKAKPAVPAMAKLLGELENSEQAAVMRTLGSIGPGAKEAIPAMEAALADGGIEAGKNLARIGPAAVPTLIKGLKSENPDVRQAAAWGLHYLGPDAHEAVPALAELVKKDEKACNFALQALGAIGPDASPAVPAIVSLLCDGDKQLQSWALGTLGEIGLGAKEAKDAVIKALNTDNEERRWEAACALIAMGEVDAGLSVVPKKFPGDAEHYSIGGIELLISAGPKAKSAAPRLVELMKDEKAELYSRIMCAKALTAIAPDDERGVVFLREQASRPDSPLSMEAALTLVELKKADAAVIARLKTGLDAKNPRAVGVCAGALAQVESERDAAIRLLREKLQEKDPQARVSAAIALANAGVADSIVVTILAGELRKEDGSGRDMDAIRALGKVIRESTEARAVVEEALHAESDAVRAAARASIQPAPNVRLSPNEAKSRIMAWYQARGETMYYEERDAQPREWTTDGIWERLHVQVFVLGMQGYLVGRDHVAAIGGSFGGFGLQSICVSDLDADGRPELLFTHSWGSGEHRSEVGAWSAEWPAPGTIAAPTEYTGTPDFTLQRIDDQRVELRIGTRRVGKLRLRMTDGAPHLWVELEADLPP
jgi:HEAT repeat protein